MTWPCPAALARVACGRAVAQLASGRGHVDPSLSCATAARLASLIPPRPRPPSKTTHRLSAQHRWLDTAVSSGRPLAFLNALFAPPSPGGAGNGHTGLSRPGCASGASRGDLRPALVGRQAGGDGDDRLGGGQELGDHGFLIVGVLRGSGGVGRGKRAGERNESGGWRGCVLFIQPPHQKLITVFFSSSSQARPLPVFLSTVDQVFKKMKNEQSVGARLRMGSTRAATTALKTQKASEPTFTHGGSAS